MKKEEVGRGERKGRKKRVGVGRDRKRQRENKDTVICHIMMFPSLADCIFNGGPIRV